jgi:hypothetical protein
MKRSEAQLLGLKTYHTGKPCIYGHLDARHTASGLCVTCARAHDAKRRSKTLGNMIVALLVHEKQIDYVDQFIASVSEEGRPLYVSPPQPLPEKLSYADAYTEGLKRYYLGTPCMQGHYAERLVKNTRCVLCERKKHRLKVYMNHTIIKRSVPARHSMEIREFVNRMNRAYEMNYYLKTGDALWL